MKKTEPFFLLFLCFAAVNGNAQNSTLKGGKLVKELAIYERIFGKSETELQKE